MRKAKVLVDGVYAADFIELEREKKYQIIYLDGYKGPSISLRLPVDQKSCSFDHFPPFFDGLLPEGSQLEALLKLAKLDYTDEFGQLLVVGHDLVGNVTVVSG